MKDYLRNFVTTLYHDRDLRFWVYQCGGWAGYSLATFLSITLMDGNVSGTHLAHIGLQAVLGVLISWPLRPIYRATLARPFPVRVVVSLSSIIVFSGLWTASRIYTFVLISGESGLWREFHYWYFGSLFVFLSWTVLYFGIHYYELLILEHQKLLAESALREKEKLRRLRAESAAREAQLKMLRYQLNPHFLFNTLNAINAHVRLGENAQGSDMIQFLSRFLRHSLQQDSVDEVSLEQELESLRLYLKIEMARFGDRLDIRYDIDDRTREALVPGLVLQPIVENAMKYAVAPSEARTTVEIRAQQHGAQLELQVLDTGPGMVDAVGSERRGIGLSNTLERLQALYGEQYEFTVGNRSPQGLVVTIRLPWREAVSALQAGSIR